MALQGFDKSYYLSAKLAALQATETEWVGKTTTFLETVLQNVYGLTAEVHYNQYGYKEGLAPNAYFNADEYKLAKATALFDSGKYLSIEAAQADFEAKWPFDPYQHYLRYGSAEGVNPSNDFDESSYLASKLASLQANPATATAWATKTVADVQTAFTAAGLSALGHYLAYGATEGIAVTAVPTAEQVTPTPTTTVGTTFTLTTGINNFTGTSSDDTFDGSLGGAAGATATLSSSDTLDGGAGTDTLTATLTGGVTSTKISNIETLTLAATGAATMSLVNATGYTTIENSGSSNVLTVNNIGSTATALGLSNTDQNSTFAYTAAAVAGTADSATLTLSNVTAGTSTIAGIETLNIVSSGGPNTMAGLTTANATKFVVTGDQNLTITAGLGTTVTEVAASALTGGLTATMGAVAAATMTGGAGNDSLTFSAVTGNVVIDGGAGNDTFTDVTNLTVTDSINGGAGTDTLTTTSAIAVAYVAPATATITNIEGLALTTAGAAGATLTTSNFGTGVNAVTLGAAAVAATVGAFSITGPAGTLTVNLGNASSDGTTDLAGLLTLTDTGTAITDAATVSNNVIVANDSFAVQAITSTGYETLTLNTKGGTASANTTAQTTGAITIAADSGGTSTLNITGANNLTTAVITANIIDASGMSGTGTFTNVGATVGATKITGSGNSDGLVGSATATSIIGGAGNDTITGGAANDTISGGDGNDSITSAAGSDTIDGGAGNDIIIFGTTDFTAADTVNGGDGTDTLQTAIAAQTALTATLTTVTNIEKLQISDGLAGAALNMARYGTSGPTTVVLAGAAGTSSITNMLASTTVEQQAVSAGTTLTVTNATDTSADALTLKLNSATGVDFGTVTAASFETFAINSTTTGATPSTYTNTLALGTTNGTAVTVTGNVAAILSTSAAAVSVATVNASAMTGGGVSWDNTNATVASTITGSSYVDTLIGGSGADTISGGDGNDSISGASGIDSLVGGSGDDTIDGGAGADYISGGDGADRINTSSGNDTIDGGSGTDTLFVSAAFANISAMTTTSVETLNMNSTATTATVAQFAGFTTVSNIAGLTFSDAGTIAANTNLTSYTLANGTNAFTASTTALDVSVLGGTGNDTINFGSAAFTDADTVSASTGTDTLNLTGNTAMTLTHGAANFLAVENIVLSNTSTAVSITTHTNSVGAGLTLTVDASSETTAAGILTFVGTVETDGYYNIIGGNAADNIIGGQLADTISGGAGADTIANQATGAGGASKADKLTGGTGADTYILRGDVASGAATTIYATAANVSDFSISGTNGIDVLQLSATSGNYSGAGTGLNATVAAAAAGATVVMSQVVDGGAVAITAGTDIIKLTTATAVAGTLQAAFNAAIGTGSVTSLTAANEIFFSLYDSTNSKMVIGVVDAGAGNTIVASADVVTLVGTMDMSAANYALFTNANYSIIAA
jgi:S-layer protein